MKLLHFPAVRLAVCLILGTISGFYTEVHPRALLTVFAFSMLFLGMLHFIQISLSRNRFLGVSRTPARSLRPYRSHPRRSAGRAFRSRFYPKRFLVIVKILPFGKVSRPSVTDGIKSSDKASIPNAAAALKNNTQKKINSGNSRKTFFSGVVFITVFIAGWTNITLHKEKNHLRHYTNYINEDATNSITFQIRKTLKPNSFYERYEVNIFRINNKKASGKLLLNIKKDSTVSPLKIDENYKVKTTLIPIAPPRNLHQFNYKAYLEKQSVYHQFYSNRKELYALPQNKIPSIYDIAASFRKKIHDALKENGFTGDELAVINALLLGQRQDISEEVYSNYTRAGAIHILAVSGLHIGIILLILNVLLQPLERIKHGKKLKLLIIVLLLWAFAVSAGLSASVVRAVTMFSFVAWAMHLKRTTNIYNILAVSIIFLLLLNPSFLFNVGFQLSYSAVFSIVWIQPMLYQQWKPPFKIFDFFWKILSVTLAAQLGVFPLSLYYFHQFPALFFVANLVIIPVLGLILGLGILTIVLALLQILPSALATAYATIITWMNTFISWIARQEAFLFKDIPFDMPLLLTVYALIIFGILAFKKPVFQRLAWVLISVILLQGVFIYNRYTTEKKHKLIIFHKNKTTLIAEQKATAILLYSANKNEAENKLVKNYSIGEKTKTVSEEKLKNVYAFDEKFLLRVDSLGVYNIPGLNPDYILLCNSPKINLERLIHNVKPRIILADGSNYKSYIQRWKATCEAQKIPFHATGEKGAFCIGK